MARLDIYTNYALQASVKLSEGETRIGRDKGCEVQLPDTRVSRIHAIIRPDGSHHEIENLGTNGTLVNDHEVKEARPLRPGDLVVICDYVLAYQEKENPALETLVTQFD
ncbi:MAG: FHA domain-containing protein [Xanthomonadales bacterium]|nr:FHA domain-containing protein [Xanthomonadales bacterium]